MLGWYLYFISVTICCCCCAAVVFQLRIRWKEPDLTKTSNKGVSHGAAIAAEAKLLLQEIEVNPPTSVKVIDNNFDFYLSKAALQYYHDNLNEKVPETQTQDEDNQEAGRAVGEEGEGERDEEEQPEA